MSSIEENLRVWGQDYRWTANGEEWSALWGTTAYLWHGTILPRIHRYLPADSILEIAPGFGRMTDYLRRFCRRLVVVELVEKCLNICRQRFAQDTHIAYHQNDGRDLSFIEDRSIDFAFTWDSLVHCELDVVQAYISQLARKLRPNGVAFIHHSNFLDRYAHLPPESLAGLQPEPSPNPHRRAENVSARLIRDFCPSVEIVCASQEIVNWGSISLLYDCFTVLTPPGSTFDRPQRVIQNINFMNEIRRVKLIHDVYGEPKRGSGSTSKVP